MIPAKTLSNPKPTWLQQAIRMFLEDRFKDGDTISHIWLKHALEIEEPRDLDDARRIQWQLLARVEAFKDWLLEERQIALENIWGEGYRIVPPREQARVAAQKFMRSVNREFKECNRTMTHTRVNELSTDEKRRHTDAHIRLIGVGEIMTRQRKDIFGLFGPTSGDVGRPKNKQK